MSESSSTMQPSPNSKAKRSCMPWMVPSATQSLYVRNEQEAVCMGASTMPKMACPKRFTVKSRD